MGQARKGYTCPTCGTTKEIRSHQVTTHMEFRDAYESMPEQVPCGWRGCTDYAIKDPPNKDQR